MHTKVKICGIKTEEEIEIVNEFCPDYIGFIFAKSPRKVTVEKAMKLRKMLKPEIQVVGVFVDEGPEDINNLIEKCQLNVVQLHGRETVDICAKIKSKVWKSVLVRDRSHLEVIPDYLPYVDGILLDTYHESKMGGTGHSFNWELIDSNRNYPLILAGGLNPDNILSAIQTVNPTVVDVNSGVETSGFKDRNKVAALFERLSTVR